MKKRIISLLYLAALCIAMLCPARVSAATPLDPAAEASLTLHYQKQEQTFADLTVAIYRVAEAFPDGTFELVAPYKSYPVNIHDITVQEQWKNTALTLGAYIVADQLAPDREGKTDETGTVVFENLQTGLYLVREVMTENESGTYVFDQFMVYLPTPQADGSFNYAVEAKPKCSNYVPKTEYRVTKLWQDAGKEAERPKQITVDIYKDGQLQETRELSAGNDWTYNWYVSADDPGVWTVAERNVSDAYTVTIQQNGGSFSIINTHRTNTGVPEGPLTGDSFAPLPWILAMCISGIMLLILGVYSRRRA